MRPMRRPGSDRRGLRAEPGLHGYRGMIAVAVAIVLVALGGLAGAFRPLVCLVDPAGCASAPSASATAPAGRGELPAATDEKAVRVTAGEDDVPPGRYRVAAGRGPVVGAGSSTPLGRLWSDDAPAPDGRFQGEAPLMALTDLPCGTATTAPCDAWPGLASDAAADQTEGAARLSLLGLDRVIGTSADMTTVDMTLPVRRDGALEGASAVLYRSSLRRSDAATTASWTWADAAGAVYQVRAERAGDGSLHALTVTAVRAGGGTSAVWTTLSIPVTDSSRDALEDWLAGVNAQEVALTPQTFEPAGDGAADDAFSRLVHSTGEATRETLALPAGTAVDARMVRDDPTHAAATVTATEVLGEPAEDGTRSFTPREGA